MPAQTRSTVNKSKKITAVQKVVTKVKPASNKVKLRAEAIKALKTKRDAGAFNAEPALQLKGTTCFIETGRMSQRSQQEVYNYAYLLNEYIGKQRGQKVKVKSTKAQRKDQATFCQTVHANNKELFGELNKNLKKKDKMFSVVGHIPDECVQTRRFGESHNQTVPTNLSGLNIGWAPMTAQANGLVSKLGLQTERSSGQPEGKGVFVTKVHVDGLVPNVLLRIKQLDDALENLGLRQESDVESEEESDVESSEEQSEGTSDEAEE